MAIPEAMPETKRCPVCGTVLPTDRLAGLCPACAWRGTPDPEGTRSAEPPSPPSSPTEQPGAHIGRYKLLEPIGEGGFGTVWMAEQTEPVRRKVALKIIKLGMDTREVVARFEAERQALAMMDHPNIARVFDGGATENGRPYFVMELVKGLRITEYCDAHRLRTEDRLKLFMDVCQAVQHAHQKGIIHRDLKPSNVLVTVQDDRPVPKVIDFGIAKATGVELTDKTLFTRFNQVIGTPAYMSPEQAGLGSLDIDTRSDIYALGVLLYELLTGRTPFGNEELFKAGFDEVLRVIREKEPPKPSTRLSALTRDELVKIATQRQSAPEKLNRLVRGELDWIVMKALEKDRARRYDSANGLARDLERHLNHEPVQAVAPSAGYQARKFARRHRVALTVAAAFVVVSLLGTVTSLRQAAKATRHASAETKAKQYAQQQERIAQVMLGRAEKQREENRQRLVRVNVANGLQLLERGDSFGALPWFVEALKLEGGVQERERMHRLRIGSVLKYAPRLVQNWFHDGPVTSAEFSPEGDRVLTAGEDGTARIWDVNTGKLLVTLLHTGKVSLASFSPDGVQVVTAYAPGIAQAWDSQTGQPLGQAMPHSGPILAARFSPDGRHILTASQDKTARIWDAATGELVLQPLQHSGDVPDAAWSPDGRLVATISGDSMVRIWESETGRLVSNVSGVGRYVYAVSFSADSRRVLWSAWSRGGVNDAATGKPVTATLTHAQAIVSAVFSPDGRTILTASEDQTVRVWDAETGDPVGFPIKHSHGLQGASYSPNGSFILTASDDGSAGLYDADTMEPNWPPLKHSGRVTKACFSPDGAYVLTAGRDGMVRLWDIATSGPESLVLRHKSLVRRTSFSPDSSVIATASSDNAARLWDARTGQLRAAPLKHDSHVVDVAFSPDGRYLATASFDGTARIWDADTGTQVGRPLQVPGKLTRVAFISGSEKLVVAGGSIAAYINLSKRVAVTNGPVKIQTWDRRTGLPGSDFIALEGSKRFATFSPDGRQVATPCEDKTVRIWDVASGLPLISITPRSAMMNVRFSPDGRLLITADGDGSDLGKIGEAQVWNVATGEPMTPPLVHRARVLAAEFSPDGLWVVTGSYDGIARIWSATTGQPRTPPLMHNYIIFDVGFSPDGRCVVTGSGDRTARVWDALTGELAAPPLRHLGFVFHSLFSPDSRRVVTALEQSLVAHRLELTAHIWDLPSDARPAEDLQMLGQLLSGHRIDSTSSLVPLEAETFRTNWATLQARYLSDFVPEPSQKLTWHEREAKLSESTNRWALAARHLQKLALARPGDTGLSNRLTTAQSQAALHRPAVRAVPRSTTQTPVKPFAAFSGTNSGSTNMATSAPGNRASMSPILSEILESGFSVMARDDFNARTSLAWEILHPNPTHVNLTNKPGCLTIVGQRNSLPGQSPNNPPSQKVLARNLHLLTNTLPADVPVMITTCLVEFQPSAALHQAGLVVYDDGTNYLKLMCEYHPPAGARIVCFHETDGKARNVWGTLFPAVPGRIWLRLVKEGNRFSAYHSLDGRKFELDESRSWGDDRPKKLGLLAKSSGTGLEFNANFDFFEVRKLDRR